MNFLNFNEFFQLLVNTGFVKLAVPFIVVFVLLFIATSQTQFFNKAIAALFSATISLLVIIPHVLGRYQRCWDFVDIMNRGLPKFGIFILAIIVLAMLLMIIGVNTETLTRFPRGLFLLTLVVITYITLTSKPRGCETFDLQTLPWGWLIMLGILLVPIVFWKKKSG